MRSYRAIAEYYDAEDEQLDILAHDVPFFLNHLPRRRRLSVLELAVGTARAAIPIAQAGHRVVGVDYAADMLAIARRKRDGVGIKESQLQLIHADVMDLKLGKKFDWVCIFFNTFLNFTTLEQQDRILQTVRRHLKSTGRFWLDIFQPNLELLAKPHSKHVSPLVFYVPSLERTVFREAEVKRDQTRQVQQITFHYRWFNAMGVEQHQEIQFELTSVFPRELRLLLERNGLRLREIYGDYDGSELTMDSPRMIATASLMK
jgi:ubiquinone/menaquinone biosynthesis C-methylase UbiE